MQAQYKQDMRYITVTIQDQQLLVGLPDELIADTSSCTNQYARGQGGHSI